jgi:hypothetical protein
MMEENGTDKKLTKTHKRVIFGCLSCVVIVGVLYGFLWMIMIMTGKKVFGIFDSAVETTETRCDLLDNSASGYLDDHGGFCSWQITTESPNNAVLFVCDTPSADFRIQVMAEDGVSLLEEYILAEKLAVVLPEAGTYWLIIYSTGESGAWSATW